MRHSIIFFTAATLAVGAIHNASVKRSRNAREYGRHGSGRYHMPGRMMTRRGKINQMQRDFQNCNRRKGKPR